MNQQVTIGGVTATWDTKGNLTGDPQAGKTYGYSSENLLTSASGGVTLGYDPAMRLYQTVGAATTRFLYDGVDAIAEYNASNALQRRFVFDPTTGQPVLWYEGTSTAAANRRYLSQDERGSVISVSSSTGASLGLNTYDEYGKPGSANIGRYQYTGQKWIGEAGLYDYKARDYLPHLGIFAQTDPIGQEDSPNLYAYVLDDPLNLVDPLGLTVGDITITACANGGSYPFCYDLPGGAGGGGGIAVGGSNDPGGRCVGGCDRPIVVTGKRKSPPRAPRRLDAYERRVFGCSGVDQQTLNNIALVGFLPPFAYLSRRTQAQTLPSGGSIGIFLRNGDASGRDNPAQMALIAHEVSHAMGYSRGVSLVDILLSYGSQGYQASDPEVTARAFSDRVMRNIRGGVCR